MPFLLIFNLININLSHCYKKIFFEKTWYLIMRMLCSGMFSTSMMGSFIHICYEFGFQSYLKKKVDDFMQMIREQNESTPEIEESYQAFLAGSSTEVQSDDVVEICPLQSTPFRVMVDQKRFYAKMFNLLMKNPNPDGCRLPVVVHRVMMQLHPLFSKLPDNDDMLGIDHTGVIAMNGVVGEMEVSSYRRRIATISSVITPFTKEGKMKEYNGKRQLGVSFLKYYFAIVTKHQEGRFELTDNRQGGLLFPIRLREDMAVKSLFPTSELETVEKTIMLIRALAYHTAGHRDVYEMFYRIDCKLRQTRDCHSSMELKIDKKDKQIKKTVNKLGADVTIGLNRSFPGYADIMRFYVGSFRTMFRHYTIGTRRDPGDNLNIYTNGVIFRDLQRKKTVKVVTVVD